MRKSICIFLSLIIVLSLASCQKNESEEPVQVVPDEKIEKSEISETIEEDEKIYNVSLLIDTTLPKPTIEKIKDFSPQKFVRAEDVIMEGETLEIWEKYIDPIDTSMPLALDFDEKNAPHGNIAIYSYIFYQCENLDNKYYGIKKSGYDMSENYWVDGRKTEESIARWFPWVPEDYRLYFDYDAETDKYFITGCGGGLEETYITDYHQEGDYLYIDFSFYNSFAENGICQIFSSHTLTIKLEEKGWKYMSNKKTYEFDKYFFWVSDDYTFGANMNGWKQGEKAEFEILRDSELYLLTVYGAMDYTFYMDGNPCALFPSKLGLIIYDFESNSIRIVENLPSTQNNPHEIIGTKREKDNEITVFYRDINNRDAQTAVIDYETLDIISHNK